jgi:hypothetical protein
MNRFKHINKCNKKYNNYIFNDNIKLYINLLYNDTGIEKKYLRIYNRLKSLRNRNKIKPYYNYEINNITKDAQKEEFKTFIDKNEFYHYEKIHIARKLFLYVNKSDCVKSLNRYVYSNFFIVMYNKAIEFITKINNCIIEQKIENKHHKIHIKTYNKTLLQLKNFKWNYEYQKLNIIYVLQKKISSIDLVRKIYNYIY